VATDLNKAYQTIILFLGVFTVAYAGFFYQKYTIEQGNDKNNQIEKASVQAANNTTVKRNYQSPAIIASRDNFQQNTQVKDQNKLDTKKHSSNRKIEKKISNPDAHNMQSQTYSNHDRSGASSYTQKTNYSQSTTGSSVSGMYTIGGSSPTSAASTTASVDSNTTFSSNLTFSDTSSGTDVDESSSTITPDDAQNNTATNAEENDTVPVYNNESEVQEWATANCPFQLAEGSDEADAQIMLQTYGCRYLKYCQNNNDGSNAYSCWWGFYSS